MKSASHLRAEVELVVPERHGVVADEAEADRVVEFAHGAMDALARPRTRQASAAVTAAAHAFAGRESMEAQVIRTYLEWVAEETAIPIG